MSTSDALTFVIALAGVLATVVAWLGWREAHRSTTESKDDARIKAMIDAQLRPVQEKQAELAARLEQIAHLQEQSQIQIQKNAEQAGRMLDRLAVLETKIEVFWRSVAMDAAKIIHSPDPRRAHIDALLEAFMANRLSDDDAVELRGILQHIRDWEPGKPSDFPVYQGEQVAAAILLNTMDHVMKGNDAR